MGCGAGGCGFLTELERHDFSCLFLRLLRDFNIERHCSKKQGLKHGDSLLLLLSPTLSQSFGSPLNTGLQNQTLSYSPPCPRTFVLLNGHWAGFSRQWGDGLFTNVVHRLVFKALPGIEGYGFESLRSKEIQELRLSTFQANSFH